MPARTGSRTRSTPWRCRSRPRHRTLHHRRARCRRSSRWPMRRLPRPVRECRRPTGDVLYAQMNGSCVPPTSECDRHLDGLSATPWLNRVSRQIVDRPVASARTDHHSRREEGTTMIDLYYWPTPNGWKITIFLEETATPYRVIPVNIGKGEQFAPAFLEISPNNRMPAIVDSDGPDGRPISIFESGAILIYLGEKTGRFLPREPRPRFEVLQWLMFQMGGVGPMFG